MYFEIDIRLYFLRFGYWIYLKLPYTWLRLDLLNFKYLHRLLGMNIGMAVGFGITRGESLDSYLPIIIPSPPAIIVKLCRHTHPQLNVGKPYQKTHGSWVSPSPALPSRPKPKIVWIGSGFNFKVRGSANGQSYGQIHGPR